MSVKDDLHELVDRLTDERADIAFAYLRRLADETDSPKATAAAALERRMGPRAVSGRTFMAQQPRSLRELASEQGVRPVTRFEDLVGDFWPEDETVDEFIATVREWRRESGRA